MWPYMQWFAWRMFLPYGQTIFTNTSFLPYYHLWSDISIKSSFSLDFLRYSYWFLLAFLITCCPSISLCTFLSSSQEPLGQFQPNLAKMWFSGERCGPWASCNNSYCGFGLGNNLVSFPNLAMMKLSSKLKPLPFTIQ